ncbi:MAG: creatininase family protein [Candidatus Hodarchaeota archaeon]
MDVEKYLEHDNRVVVTVGSCEQHGYLSLLTDTIITAKVAQEACEKEGVLMTPPFSYGISSAWTAYPGTISLKPATFIAVMQEIVEGLLAQGFHRILLNNGHGGNTGALGWLQDELNNTHQGIRVNSFHWWYHPIVMKVFEEVGLPQGHANWAENFPFTRVGSVPEGEKELLKEWPRAPTAADYRTTLGDGSTGGLYQTSDDIMDRLFIAAVEAMVTELRLL